MIFEYMFLLYFCDIFAIFYLHCIVVCCVWLCFTAVLRPVVFCCAVWFCAVLCRDVLCCAVPCSWKIAKILNINIYIYIYYMLRYIYILIYIYQYIYMLIYIYIYIDIYKKNLFLEKIVVGTEKPKQKRKCLYGVWRLILNGYDIK